jgi:hypothetical protein
VNWLRRWRRATEEDSGSGESAFDPIHWVRTLPDAAQLLVYSKGKYVGRCYVQNAQAEGLERMLEQGLGVGVYTVLPHFDGRLHPGRQLTIGTFAERNTRDQLNKADAACAEHAQSGGVVSMLGVAGRMQVARAAIDNNVWLDDPGMVHLVRLLDGATEGSEPAEPATPDEVSGPEGPS